MTGHQPSTVRGQRTFADCIGQKLFGLPWGIFPPEFKALQQRFHAELKSLAAQTQTNESATASEQETLVPASAGNIAVIPIHGIIGKHLSWIEMLFFGGCDLCSIDALLDSVARDNSVSTAILDVRSPGG